MLAELETEIIASLRNSPVAGKLRAIDALPDLTPDTLNRIATTAPAVYVVAKDVQHNPELELVSFDLLCLSRNLSSPKAARQGDTTVIGLYHLLDHVAFWFSTRMTDSTVWNSSRTQLLRQGAWQGLGLQAGSVSISGKVQPDMMPYVVDSAELGLFTTFHADYDIPPSAGATEHAKWLHEPADYSTSKPELSDTTIL